MATRKKAVDTEEVTVTEEVVAAEEKTEEKTYPLSNLAKNCRALFGISSCTFAGATVGLDASGQYSVEYVKGIINAWCGKKGVK
ncbi:MAG: hypothetical protein LUC83_02505 [Clostridiales bacterium]|nr:hypothetical protein [Clostridiales bacterium]